MRNKMSDLNNHLFAQIERLSDEEISQEQLKLECQRGKAISELADKLIESTRVTVDAMKLLHNSGFDIKGAGEKLLEGK